MSVGVVQWVNATFELVGALLAWRSVVELQRAGVAQGVYWPQFAFSAAWAVECIPYYLAQGDGASATCAGFRCAALVVWSHMARRVRA